MKFSDGMKIGGKVSNRKVISESVHKVVVSL